MKRLKNPTVLKDAVYNIAMNSGSCDEYAKGIMVGAAAGLMAMGHTFQDALAHLAILSPEPIKMRATLKIVPESWAADYVKEYMASHNFKDCY